MPAESQNDNGLSIAQRLRSIKRAITAQTLAELLAISPITVYRMARTGQMPSLRVGTTVRFDPARIAKWLEETV